jgi:hypothetical protein
LPVHVTQDGAGLVAVHIHPGEPVPKPTPEIDWSTVEDLGRVPDREIAARLGVAESRVRAARQELARTSGGKRPAPDARRITLTLDEPARSILEEQDNASAYVAELVESAERRWRGHLVYLRTQGWTGRELLAVCDVLNGYAQLGEFGSPGLDGGAGVALEMSDAQRLNGIAEKWDVAPGRWEDLVRQASSEAAVGRALSDIAAEFWRHSSRLERALEQG